MLRSGGIINIDYEELRVDFDLHLHQSCEDLLIN